VPACCPPEVPSVPAPWRADGASKADQDVKEAASCGGGLAQRGSGGGGGCGLRKGRRRMLRLAEGKEADAATWAVRRRRPRRGVAADGDDLPPHRGARGSRRTCVLCVRVLRRKRREAEGEMTGRRARRGGCEGGGADGSEEWRGIRRQTRVRGRVRGATGG
jgi:hypothetical protein